MTYKSGPNNISNTRGRGEKRMVMAKRGLRSLAVALGLPLSLTILSIYFLGGGYRSDAEKPFWFPPLWVVHISCVTTTFLMGLSGWLVWAEGGFHKQPTTLYMYGAQMGSSLILVPLVCGLNIPLLGLLISMCLLGALIGCSHHFRITNPIAADLVKPCIAWAAFLIILNLKLIYM
ncbi:Translocator protein homolog [Linum grandiflorum]